MHIRQKPILIIVLTLLLALPALTVTAQDNPCGESVTVVQGDTLNAIAQRCNVTVAAILQANPDLSGADADLVIGQTLAMPTTDAMSEPPIVAMTPLSGAPGTMLRLIANGFPPNTPVIVGLGPVASEYEVVARPQTDGQGTLYQEVQLPNFAQAGERWVAVVETETRTARAVSYEFEVTTPGTGTPPSASVSPLSAPAGGTVQLVAQGFPANTSVIIGVGEQIHDYAYSRQATTTANGTLNTSITIPDTAPVGSTWIVLVEVEANRDYEAISPRITVTGAPGPEPTDDTALFDSANIYLVAINDGGASGIPIGCNDSLVPVQVRFQPTVAPLTSALEELLAIDTEYYGQSGLYNALYQSELTVTGIDIENGLATINLSGTLMSGGTCDTPRIQGQLEQTALQYSTIDRVEIYVNGQSLDSLLSAR